MVLRKDFEKIEQDTLADYAFKSSDTRGRIYPEDKHPYRTDFQRDRDRIIHSTAFRRLQYKTQVFVNHEGDHFRTRLTHTIEVSQISRTIARALRLNEDLTEAIALAHDLGHTPFGHSGEEALNELMSDHGGFEHNRQTLRVVDLLERKYPTFPGLNLTYEIREGIVKHETDYDIPNDFGFHPEEKPLLECQVVSCADEIAYNCHDLDDGLDAGLISEKDVSELDIWRELADRARADYPNLPGGLRQRHVVRMLIDREVTSLINHSTENIKRLAVETVDDIRKAPGIIVGFDEDMRRRNDLLKKFLFDRMYRHHRMVRMSKKAKRIIKELFTTYMENPDQMPPSATGREEPEGTVRLIADYIAGMTDRYALQEHQKLFSPFEIV
jgi:dGTPase